MFLNLYELSEGFRNFNWALFQELHRVDASSWRYAIHAAIHENEHIEPVVVEAMQFTLSPRCCDSFFRANPELPAKPRDYYLSKLLQLLIMTIEEGHSLIETYLIQDQLATALERFPDELLPRICEQFYLQHFIDELRRELLDGDHDSVLKWLTVDRVFDQRSSQPTSAEKPRPQKRPQVRDPKLRATLARRRRDLYADFKARGGQAKRLYLARGGVHRSQVYQWLHGELADSSAVTMRIEAEISGFLKKV